MTRYARAKGSKASNERIPEEATSWSEMKQQLLTKNKEIEENKKRQEIHSQRNATYKAFLEEREENESKKTTWADFPGSIKPVKQIKKREKNTSKISSKNNNKFDNKESSEDKAFALLKTKVDNVLNMNENNYDSNIRDNLPVKDGIVDTVIQGKKSKKKKKVNKLKEKSPEKSSLLKRESLEIDSDSDAPPEEATAKKEVIIPVARTKKAKQKKLKIIDPNSKAKTMESEEITNKPQKKRKIIDDDVNGKKFKKTKTENNGISNLKTTPNKGNQTKKIIKENLTEKDLRKIEKKKQKRYRQVLKKNKVKAELKQQKEEMKKKEESISNPIQTEQSVNENKSFNNSGINKRDNVAREKYGKHTKFNIKAKEKVRGKEEKLRKKPLIPSKMFINGKELEIEYVDGFPIKKEDAERIKKLRREMISKGLPRSEINVALKLERRKAEKAFTREKKKVCFNCRKSGHNLSECPELNKDQVAHTAGSGICFKCGSTEHTHFECKVVRGQEFKFAQCFICNEQGHIARQCPDNARGLYPKGGACNVCGDVTHLKKDCPIYQAQQQRRESNLKIETFGDSNPDILEENGNSVKKIVKRPNKIIKF